MANSYDITDDQTGQTLTVEGDTPPTAEDAAAIFAQQRTPVVPARQPTPMQPAAAPPNILDLGMEAIAGFNRPFAWLADKTLMVPFNAVQQLRGKPFFSIEGMVGDKGQFAGEGLAVDVAAAAGELASIGIGGGSVTRGVASLLDDATRIGGSTLNRVLKQLGRSTPSQDIAMGLTAGAGGEITAEIATQILGEDAEQIGRMIGQVVSPVAWGFTTSQLLNAGKNLLKDSFKVNVKGAAPTTQQLKGAARAIYTQLDSANITADAGSRQYIAAQVQKFKIDEEISDSLYPTVNRIGTILENKATGTDGISYRYLDRAHSLLRRVGASDNSEGAAAERLALIVDDMIMNIKPTNTEAIGTDTVESLITNAREFWRRGKSSEIMDDLFNKARIDATANRGDLGVNIRRRLAATLKNKKALRSFTPSEVARMEKVVQGSSAERSFELFGSFGANSDDWYKAIMLSSVATAGSLAVGGSPAGAAAAISLGAAFSVARVAKWKAGRLLANNAQLMKATLAANGDAKKIIESYVRTTPREARNTADLSALLLTNKADLSALRDAPLARSPFISDAILLTQMGSAAMRNEEDAKVGQQQ